MLSTVANGAYGLYPISVQCYVSHLILSSLFGSEFVLRLQCTTYNLKDKLLPEGRQWGAL